MPRREHTVTNVSSLDDRSTLMNRLARRFDSGYGSTEGYAFCVMTQKRVYFPVVYDGAEWVGSAPRIPSEITYQTHVGGE